MTSVMEQTGGAETVSEFGNRLPAKRAGIEKGRSLLEDGQPRRVERHIPGLFEQGIDYGRSFLVRQRPHGGQEFFGGLAHDPRFFQ